MCLRKSSRLGLALLVIFHLATSPIHALSFVELKLKTGKTILFVHDCGKLPDEEEKSVKLDGTKGCDEWESAVSGPQQVSRTKAYPGDARVLNEWLSSKEKTGNPYDEVWLYSGGGDLNEGIAMAKILRQHHATVRVPKGVYCISSCTVIFMGGYFRYVDDGASYRVHSGSTVLEGAAAKPDESIAAHLIAKASKDPDQAFSEFATIQQVRERKLARVLERLFQNTLLIPFKTYLPDDDDVFEAWATTSPPHLAYVDSGNRQRAADVKRFKAEGPACVQDIAMRIERDAMAQAIKDVRAILPSLGKRADYALDMVSTMYMTSIKETSDLSLVTLRKMGYITDDNIPQQ